VKKIKRIILTVLDSAGVGELPDAYKYDDAGSNTLGHIGEALGLEMPNMGKMGLGNIIPIKGTPEEKHPTAKYGKASEKSNGKDTTIGHWEIAGIIMEKPLPTYPEGFPEEIISEFEDKIGRKTLGNKTASGIAIINELGREHEKTGYPIVYTSADSVFQIAAHEEIIPIKEQYRICEIARKICDKYMIGRVIARPFIGKYGNYTRTTNRHDYSLMPVKETVLDRLKTSGFDVIGIGKISDIFGGRGITEYTRTKSNMDGVDKIIEYIKKNNSGLIFTNLLDFDMLYGHRRDIEGYKKALQDFDLRIPEIINNMKDSDLLIITADHGCDPTFKGSDHTREYVPIIAYSKSIEPGDIGTRESFSDIADTIDSILLGIKKENSFI
jgi:phosphopentomutase